MVNLDGQYILSSSRFSLNPNPSDLKDYETNERDKAGKWGDDERGSATPLKPSSQRRKPRI